MKTLEEKLGYSFFHRELLERALTHSSYSHENKDVTGDNERMEFLGDAVLGMIVSEMLYKKYPADPEGRLSVFRQHLVCEATLERLARSLSLGEVLLLGKGEERQGGRERRSILADAMEAVIAAIWLDAEEERRPEAVAVIQRLLTGEMLACDSLRSGDYKPRLQQLVEQGGKELLDYRIVAVSGPPHAPHFMAEALLNSNVIGRGEGSSKQEAEQHAAKEALVLFGFQDF